MSLRTFKRLVVVVVAFALEACVPLRTREGAVVIRCYQARTGTSSTSRLVVVLMYKRDGAPPETLGQMEVDGECRWTVSDGSHRATVAP